MFLNSEVTKEFRLNEYQKKALDKLGVKTVFDLLYHFPARYGDTNEIKMISNLEKGEEVVIFGKISGLKTSKAFIKKIPMSEGTVSDESGSIKCVWFNQPYIAKMIGEGSMVRIEGKVAERKNELYFSNPKIENAGKVPVGVGNNLFGTEGEEHSLYPIYPESRGVTSNWFYHAIQKIILNKDLFENIEDPIPEEILKKYSLPTLKTALIWIHAPKKVKDAESARKRFAFQEIFLIQIEKQKNKLEWQKEKSFIIDTPKDKLSEFISHFAFKPTESQMTAIKKITDDFKKGFPMSRLLEGDVGSGKTAVAASSVYAVTNARPNGQDFGNLQTAYMVPTEILAKQHFESFISFFKHLPIKVGLVTSSECRIFPSKTNKELWTHISKPQLLKWVKNGEVPILIGTHSLIQKSVEWKHLAFVIIDEQHRFGTNQRKALVRGTNAEQTRNVSEKEENIDLLYKDLTYRVREALFKVKKELGGGHKEIIYQNALAEEFTKTKLNFSRENRIPIKYNKKIVGTYIPDFVVENKIIVELKALNFVGGTEKKQIWNYLKGSEYCLALLVNFGNKELTIDRIIYEQARNSAFVPHSSASIPHLLSMTATPIPRTLALTMYGDLDLTLLEGMPHGRKPIISKIILGQHRNETYEEIKKELKAGRQLYVICPRIDEPDPTKEMAILAKSVKLEAERLKKEVFKEYNIDILHSKMTPKEKDEVMDDFLNHKIDILVATSVVEVGVNVPNATMIIIEGAERFGLSQLHQLRGRVIRSNHQAYCYIFSEGKSQKTRDRLKAIITAKNGFELAEFDLAQRGAGELSGAKQWGISDLAMTALQNMKMVEAAREEATKIVMDDFELKKYPQIKKILAEKNSIHFE